MASDNNPAGRLHALLVQAKVPSSQNDKTRVRERWAEVLGVDPDDTATLLSRLSSVIALPSQVRSAVQGSPDIDDARYLQHLPRIEQAFSTLNFQSPWHAFARPINEATMVALDLCDERLSSLLPDATLPEDARKDIHGRVRDLFEDVLANEDDTRLREFLLVHLQAMDHALQQYRVTGAPPLSNALQGAVGDLVIRSARGERLPESPRYTKFKETLTMALLSLNLVTQAVALPGVLAELPGEVAGLSG